MSIRSCITFASPGRFVFYDAPFICQRCGNSCLLKVARPHVAGYAQYMFFIYAVVYTCMYEICHQILYLQPETMFFFGNVVTFYEICKFLMVVSVNISVLDCSALYRKWLTTSEKNWYLRNVISSETLKFKNRQFVLYCGRVPAANAPGCTAAEGLLYKPWSLVIPTCTARCLHQSP